MSTEKTGTEIIDVEALLAGMAKQATKSEKPSSSVISFKSGMISYNKTPAPGNQMDVIIIASTHTNAYYEGKYDPDNIASPVCFAYSPDGENMSPHPKSSKPQHDNCATCPMNQWKSDPNGGKGKACKNGRSLAVIPADTKPEEVLNAEVAVASLPVTSVANFSNYVNKVATLFNRPPLGLITKLKTTPDMKTQFKVLFENMDLLGADMLVPLIKKAELAAPMLIREYEPNVEVASTDNGKAKKF